MAQRTQVILVDDIDGSEATQTVTFGIDGVTYEIDLNEEHAAALRESVEEWTAKARRVSGRRNTRRRARSSVPGETQRIRDWARAEGIEVSTRGRISAEVREAYLKANAGAEPGSTRAPGPDREVGGPGALVVRPSGLAG